MPDTPESLNTNSEESCVRHNDSPSSKGGWSATFVLLGRLGGIGWFVAITIGLGAYGGYWLDRQFGTAPFLTVLVFSDSGVSKPEGDEPVAGD